MTETTTLLYNYMRHENRTQASKFELMNSFKLFLLSMQLLSVTRKELLLVFYIYGKVFLMRFYL